MSQQFCLKWNNHTNNMLEIFGSLLSTESFVDVTIACDGKSVKAHKMVLSACSPFFQSLFKENPCKHPIVIMRDVMYNDLKAIIDFMYKGEVNVSQDQLSGLLKTAEMLKVKGLAEVSGEKGAQSSNVQQEVPVSVPSTSQPQPIQREPRPNSQPLHAKRKRVRNRKSSIEFKAKESGSSDIEELSESASMEADASLESHRSSVNISTSHRQSISFADDQFEEAPLEEEFETIPTKLLRQSFSTDQIPPMSASSTSGVFSPSSSAGMENAQMSESQALVPLSSSDISSQLQRPDSPLDIKPTIIFEEASSETGAMSDISMPSTSSGFQDQTLVPAGSPAQGLTENSRGILEHISANLERYASTKSKKIFYCNMCAFSCKNVQDYCNHELKHMTKMIKCHVCLKMFSSNSHLSDHLTVHTGELLYSCKVCSKMFRYRMQLSRHRQVCNH